METHQDESVPEAPGEQTNLDRKYGRIGISALAAALLYQGQTTQQPRSRRADRAAIRATDEAA
jgi:hypothetical protein